MSPDIQRIYRLFHDLYVLLDAGDREVLQPFGLTSSQYTLLTLLDTDQGQRLTTLSDRLLVARSTITRLVDQLEAAGLVHRVIDPADRRAQRVALSLAGEKLVTLAAAAHQLSLGQRLNGLPESEQRALMDLLVKVRSGLRANLQIADTD